MGGASESKLLPPLPKTAHYGKQYASAKAFKGWEQKGYKLCGAAQWPKCDLPFTGDLKTQVAWVTAVNDAMAVFDAGKYDAVRRVNQGKNNDGCTTEGWYEELAAPVLTVGGMIAWNLVDPFDGVAKGVTTLATGAFGYTYANALFASGKQQQDEIDTSIRYVGVFAGGGLGGFVGMMMPDSAINHVAPLAGGAAGYFIGPMLLSKLPLFDPIFRSSTGLLGTVLGWVNKINGWVNWTLCKLVSGLKGPCHGRAFWRLDTLAAAFAWHEFPTNQKKRRRLFNAILTDMKQFEVADKWTFGVGIASIGNDMWMGHLPVSCDSVEAILKQKKKPAWVSEYNELIAKVAAGSDDAPLFIPEIDCDTYTDALFQQGDISYAAKQAVNYMRRKTCKNAGPSPMMVLAMLSDGKGGVITYDMFVREIASKFGSYGAPTECAALNVARGAFKSNTRLAKSLKKWAVTKDVAVARIAAFIIAHGGDCKFLGKEAKPKPIDPFKGSPTEPPKHEKPHAAPHYWTYWDALNQDIGIPAQLGEYGTVFQKTLSMAQAVKWRGDYYFFGIPKKNVPEDLYGAFGVMSLFAPLRLNEKIANGADFLFNLKSMFANDAANMSAALQWVIPALQHAKPITHMRTAGSGPGYSANEWWKGVKDTAAGKELAAIVAAAPNAVHFKNLRFTPEAYGVKHVEAMFATAPRTTKGIAGVSQFAVRGALKAR